MGLRLGPKRTLLFVYPGFLAIFASETTGSKLYQQSSEIIIGSARYTLERLEASAFLNSRIVKHFLDQFFARAPNSLFLSGFSLHFKPTRPPIPREPRASSANNSANNAAYDSRDVFVAHLSSPCSC